MCSVTKKEQLLIDRDSDHVVLEMYLSKAAPNFFSTSILTNFYVSDSAKAWQSLRLFITFLICAKLFNNGQ